MLGWQSLWKSFPGYAACSVLSHGTSQTKCLQVQAAGVWVFSGQCHLEMNALLVMLSGQVSDFKMIAKFIASPPFYCPWSGDPWGFALLCKGAAWLLRPAFPLGECILQWWLLFRVFTAASFPVLPLI